MKTLVITYKFIELKRIFKVKNKLEVKDFLE